MCADKVDGLAIAISMAEGKGHAPSAFAKALATLRETASPATLDMAEGLLSNVGGAAGLAKMLVEDFHSVRGTHVAEPLKPLFQADHKTLNKYYALISKILGDRDEMLQGGPDPLETMTEDDLILLASETARTRLRLDAEFRRECLEYIYSAEPDLVQEYALARMGIPSIRQETHG